jgi:uncharacterized membrane protein
MDAQAKEIKNKVICEINSFAIVYSFWYYIHINLRLIEISERVQFFCFWYLDEP